MRYFIEIAFDGTKYHGWQKQSNGISIQQVIEEKISLKLKNNICVIGCGRTDTGVHARQFFLHFDWHQRLVLEEFQHNLNRFLPDDIAVKSIHIVKPDAHARFSAVERTYKYYIETKKNPFNRQYSLEFTLPLNIDLMNRACELLLNNDDFTSFSKSHGGQHNNICKLTKCYWEKKDNQLIFTISSNRFTRNMVRSIVGTMIDIGREKISILQFKDIIESRNRRFAGQSVEAKGLFLEEVVYPLEIFTDSFRPY
ncbi:MAG: tRNA pseudouridine(38-40) synthase TruA [Bacteroidales bacterium]